MRSFSVALLFVLTPISAAVADEPPLIVGQIKAVGIAGAGAVAQVGFFHPGGPIHDKPELAALTQPGRVLDKDRVLVASSSNYGAPRALPDAPEGAVLSLELRGSATLVVPPGFAADGNQASAADGRIQLFTAQSPAFVNRIQTPGAASAKYPSVSNPLAISINNAFGRLWFANAPLGADGMGTESIVDPAGEPLANAPSKLVGGVFAGDLTNRPQQIVPGGLKTGVVATALLGASPDGSKRAVFAALTADGALAQEHTEFALDGLAPAGTVTPIPVTAKPDDAAPVTRAGMLLNWVPNRILYVTDPAKNAIIALTLATDDKVFRVASQVLLAPAELRTPIDLAPVIPEIANPGFASNTTLAGNSDLYVLNRGNGTVVRMRQDGTVVAVRRVALSDGHPLGGGRLNGIAVSDDAQKIWVTVSGAVPDYPDQPGVLLELPAFGPGHSAAIDQGTPGSDARAERIANGARVFAARFSPEDGLGPLYNAQSCLDCHQSPAAGGMGKDGLAIVSRVGRFDGNRFDPLSGRGGPVARAHTIAELGFACDLPRGPPARANLISLRNAPALYGLGLVDSIPDAVIRAGAVDKGDVNGRVNLVRDLEGKDHVGRFGWKADTATLEQFVGEAFRNELGITNPLAPLDLVASPGCRSGKATALDDDGTLVAAVTAYLAALPAPTSRASDAEERGETLFSAVGCADCHTPALRSSAGEVPLYSDLLLHDMGPLLNDNVIEGSANGADWRTTPLWGLGTRQRFLHDGRAVSVREAILVHGGEGSAAVERFRRSSADDQAALLQFLAGL